MTLETYGERFREWLEYRTRFFGDRYAIEGRSVSRNVWITEQVENAVSLESERRDHRIAEAVKRAERDRDTVHALDLRHVTPDMAAAHAAIAADEIRKGR
ncbi:hypothetical protein [Nocardiopsis dassonvillei]|uniref:hypothetical protein n=1 Tax=Nocardiopsis dassonvillei TaxID=2014 RepID=UPI003636BAF4